MNRLNGKTAVITGGATAKRFIDEGAFVFIFGRRQKELDAAVASLGPHVRAVQGSVSDEADLDRLYTAVKTERGTLDIVFANAGVGSQLKLGEITAKHIDETFDVNVKGTIFTVQKALPLMGEGGSIILTGSSIQRLQRKQGGCAQPRADLGGGSEGHRHPGQRVVARADGHRTREGSARRGGPEGLRLDDCAPTHGRSGGGRGGCCLSRILRQQLHDRQRGRRRRRPGATLRPARSRASQTLERRHNTERRIRDHEKTGR